jgi:hypothetical protein
MVLAMGKGMDLGIGMGIGNTIPPNRMLVFYYEIR